MILPNEPRLTDEQLTEVQEILADFGCSVQPIIGAHRTVYAIIGDERADLMIKRIEGLTYIERVDRVESPFKLMDVRSDLAKHSVRIGETVLGEAPTIIAGHCTIDPRNPELFYQTANRLKDLGVTALRGGVWKPRTQPHSYQGDDGAMAILVEARAQTGLPIVAEVMDERQLRIALDAGVDVLQIGTRNALNYSLLKEIGRSTAGTTTVVLLKRGRHIAPVDEFISAAEYIAAAGNPNVVLCPRGTMPALDGYRNHPDEAITPLLRRKTWAPVVVDPSHSVGKAEYVEAASLAATAYGADGLIIECHVDPMHGIGDDPKQAVTPEALEKLITHVKAVWAMVRG